MTGSSRFLTCIEGGWIMIKRAFLFLLGGLGFATLGAQGVPTEKGGGLGG